MGCDPVERGAPGSIPGDSVAVGAAWPWAARGEMLYRQGLQLAQHEINRAGGVNGRPVRLVYGDDRQTVDQGRRVAQRFADDPAIVAVVGHLQSYTTLPAASIYDRAGIVLLAPSATDPTLTERGYRHVFRTTPTSNAIGRHLANTAANRGFQRLLISYVDSEYGRVLANAVERQADARGLSVSRRQAYSPSLHRQPGTLRAVVRDWTGADAVVLVGSVPGAALLVARARAEGVTLPILGSNAMAVPSLLHLGGAAVEGVTVPTRFHPDAPREPVQRFVEAFRARYGVMPGLSAAAAYDALHVWAAAARRAGSPAPQAVAEALRTLPPHPGATGTLAFTDTGDLTVSSLKTVTVQDGRFVLDPVPATP